MKRSEICLRQQVHNTYVLHQSQAVLKHKFDHVQLKISINKSPIFELRGKLVSILFATCPWRFVFVNNIIKLTHILQ